MDNPVRLADLIDNMEPPVIVTSDEAVTWDQLTCLEPRLTELRARARRVRDPGGPSFCANRVWFSEFKPELVHLVGWLRRKEPWILCTSQAYEVAYQTIYDELPNCRRCGCF